MTLRTAYDKAVNALKRQVHGTAEIGRDMYAPFHEPKVLEPAQLKLDEYKIVMGGLAVLVGAVEASPVAAACGMIDVLEAVKELKDAGHKWRANHGIHPAALRNTFLM